MNAGAKGKTILRLNVDKIQAGDMSENVRLEDDDMILVKDKRGRVIGFERLNFLSAKQRKDGVNIPVEVQMG